MEVNVLVKPDVYLTPDVADFGRLSVSQLQRTPGVAELTKQTFIVKRRQGSMRITSVESDIPFLNVETTPDGASEGFKLEAGLDFSKITTGPFHGTIVLRTDDETHPLLEIPVTGSIRP